MKLLVKKYIVEKKSLRTIADELSISYSQVRKRLKELKVVFRTQKQTSKGQNNPMFGRTGELCPSYRHGKCSKKYYCKCGKEITYQSALYGSGLCRSCSNKEQYKKPGELAKRKKLIKKALKSPEIRIKMSLAHKGKNNPMFGKKYNTEEKKQRSLDCGGTGIPYENTDYPAIFYEMRPIIKKRDNYKCQMSGMSEKEHLRKFGRCLDVHHIDYNKQNCREDNLISLTHIWNTKVNTNRKYWSKYFHKLVKHNCLMKRQR